MSSHLTPLDVCARLIAPVKDLGKILGRNEKYAYGLVTGSSWRDAGDLPPRMQRRVLAYAAAHGIPLRPDHVIWGAPAAEIEAIAQAMAASAQVAAQ